MLPGDSLYFVTDGSITWVPEDAVRRGVRTRLLVEGDITDTMHKARNDDPVTRFLQDVTKAIRCGLRVPSENLEERSNEGATSSARWGWNA